MDRARGGLPRDCACLMRTDPCSCISFSRNLPRRPLASNKDRTACMVPLRGSQEDNPRCMTAKARTLWACRPGCSFAPRIAAYSPRAAATGSKFSNPLKISTARARPSARPVFMSNENDSIVVPLRAWPRSEATVAFTRLGQFSVYS